MRFKSATERPVLLGRGSSKQQSAMEYLMTYGWAILIIAVVLGVLYYLGIFNGQNLTPRLQPGSCHVARTSAGVENFGVCAGLPEFVAQFNGQSSYVMPGGFSWMSSATQNFTYSIWIDPTSVNGVVVSELGQQTVNSGWHDSWLELVNGNAYIRFWSYPCVSISSIPTGTWTLITVTGSVSGGTLTYSGYVNGVFANSISGSRFAPNTGIGYYALGPADITSCGSGASYSGSMANYQFYNASLSAAEVKALYMEGIGGAPIVPQSIAGWWPLNGDTNDYSGNNNNGQPTDVQYTNTWISSYSAP